ncbi:MAG: hypothetical protein KC933_07405 [Myxococcales bacterium]|nr:hypothetical protein [Myxococcales bacterium]
MSAETIASIEAGVLADLDGDRPDDAQQGIDRLLRAQPRDREAALALVRVVASGKVAIERGLTVFEAVFASHRADAEVLSRLGDATDHVRDIDDLNLAAPASSLFPELVERLEACVHSASGTAEEIPLLSALAATTRMMARQRDALAGWCYRRLTELAPTQSHHHYNLGLYCKTRGLFAEGLRANQAAGALEAEPLEGRVWNEGICATGAGEGAIALAIWQGMRQVIQAGRFGLPEGRYPSCKVRLAQRPLAERTAAEDDPGLEETIWIERLSPCHGIIRSVLYQQLGVDYGDVVMIDGAPITYHRYGEDRIPVFPHLATLLRQGYQLYDFAGTQQAQGELAEVSGALDDDAVVYVHTEQFVTLCQRCWRSEQTDHEQHSLREAHVVVGRVAAPPQLDPVELLRQLDQAVADRPSCKLYVPELCEVAGLPERADFERRRSGMIRSARGA